MKVILASQSPRRRQLLKELGVKFDVIPAVNEEKIPKNMDVYDVPQQLAYEKAREVFDKNKDALVIGCDTVVIANNQILGKPKDAEDAARMLKILQNSWHEVVSGLCVMTLEKTYLVSEISRVKFLPMSQSQIESYIATGEPMDKAGSYGIQGIGGKYIEKYEGSYTSIVGLPVEKLTEILKQEKVL